MISEVSISIITHDKHMFYHFSTLNPKKFYGRIGNGSAKKRCALSGEFYIKCALKHLLNNNNGTKPHKQEVLKYDGKLQEGIY